MNESNLTEELGQLASLIQAEEQDHEETMNALRQRKKALEASILSEKNVLNQERQIKNEGAHCFTPYHASRTGCSPCSASSTESILSVENLIKQCLGSFLGTKSFNELLSQLEAAAKSSIVPRDSSTGFYTISPSSRTSNLLCLFHSSVRGVAEWSSKHCMSCQYCSKQASAMALAEHAFRPSSASPIERAGLNLKPRLEGIPNKKGYSLRTRLLAQKGLHQRGDDELFIPLVRFSLLIEISHSSSLQSDDFGRKFENLLNSWASRVMTLIVQTCCNALPKEKESEEMRTAVEVFLHTLSVQVTVGAASSSKSAVNFERGASGSSSPSQGNSYQIQIVFSTPQNTEIMARFFEVLHDSEMRRTLVFRALQPALAEYLGKWSSLESMNSFLFTGLLCFDALWSAMSNYSGFTIPSLRFSVLRQWYFVLLALGLHGTEFQLDVAWPTSKKETDDSSQTLKMVRSTLGFIRGLMTLIAPPPPPPVPLRCDPNQVDLCMSINNLPKSLMEPFSSKWKQNDDSSQGSSSLLTRMVSKAKVSIGMHFFTEFCIDVYRPFSVSTGVRIAPAAWNSHPCDPVVEFSPEITNANVMIASAYDLLKETLDKIEARVTNHCKQWNHSIQENESSLSSKLAGGKEEVLEEMKADFTALGVLAHQWKLMKWDWLLPFHQFERCAPSASKSDPLLYASVKVQKTN